MMADGGLNAECKRPSFKANPIPAFCSFPYYDQEVKNKEQERNKRIKKAAEESYAKARMPSRMQKDAD